MKKWQIIYLIFLFFSVQSDAQSLIGNNLYSLNPFALHPAYAGYQDELEAVLQARTRQMNTDENYTGSLLQVNGKVNEHVGLGAKLATNKQGIFEDFSLTLVSSYTTQLQENHHLSFGIGLGITNFSINTNNFSANQFADASDPLLRNGAINQSAISISTGMLYRWKDLALAISAPSLFQEENGVRERITGSMQYTFGNGNLSVTPSILARFYEINPTEITVNARLAWKEKLWLQSGYRNNESFLFGAGFYLNEITLGYSYGLTTGAFNDLATGGHELLLGIRFGKKEDDGKE
ncbi:MAG: PorP/SprF family type IX secretion system membrane protein [Flammeovirgaceae bacterium]